MKEKLKKLKINIKKEWKMIKSDPKKYWITLLNGAREYVKNNTLFFTFVLTSVFNALMLRFFTIQTMENFFSLGPLLADFAIVTLVGSFCYLMKPKNRTFYLFMILCLFTTMCIINSIYYTFYNSFASISLLSTSRFVVDVGDAVIKNVLHVTDWLYLWGPVAFIVVYYKLKKNKQFYTKEDKEEIKNKYKFKRTFAVGFVAAIAFFITLTPVKVGRFVNLWNREYIVMNFGIYTYHINDLIHSVEPQITTLFGYDSAMKTFKEYYKNTPKEQTKKNEYTGIFEGKNIIGIHAESMQQFVLGLKFNGKEVTPNLNKFSEQSIYFDNFYTQVSVGTSSDTEFTLNTSLMPTNNGTAFVSYFDREYVTMPKLLQDKGYYTFSMHANRAAYWNRDIMHQRLGYEHFYSKDEYVIDDVIGLGLSDKSFFKQSVTKIKEINKKGQPYYGTLLMLTNHTPFDKVDKYGEFPVDLKGELTLNNGVTKQVSYPYMEGTKLGDYFKSVHYADAALGEFFTSLEQEGLLDNTVIVLYGDHDARLPIEDYVRLYNYDPDTNGVFKKEDPRYKEFNDYDYELNRKVPLIIWSKETSTKLHTKVDTVMGMYDLMPTLGNMFNFYNPYQLGHDIFNASDDNIVVFPNSNWLTNKVYYNAQQNAYLSLENSVISKNYIALGNKYANNLLKVSNSLVVFDLIKKEHELENIESEYINEREIKQ
ncbi:MAG: LTA synthase family protein [Bacilli bacterium]